MCRSDTRSGSIPRGRELEQSRKPCRRLCEQPPCACDHPCSEFQRRRAPPAERFPLCTVPHVSGGGGTCPFTVVLATFRRRPESHTGCCGGEYSAHTDVTKTPHARSLMDRTRALDSARTQALHTPGRLFVCHHILSNGHSSWWSLGTSHGTRAAASFAPPDLTHCATPRRTHALRSDGAADASMIGRIRHRLRLQGRGAGSKRQGAAGRLIATTAGKRPTARAGGATRDSHPYSCSHLHFAVPYRRSATWLHPVSVMWLPVLHPTHTPSCSNTCTYPTCPNSRRRICSPRSPHATIPGPPRPPPPPLTFTPRPPYGTIATTAINSCGNGTRQMKLTELIPTHVAARAAHAQHVRRTQTSKRGSTHQKRQTLGRDEGPFDGVHGGVGVRRARRPLTGTEIV